MMGSVAVAVVDYLLNSLWQLPLVLLAAVLAAFAVRRLGPAAVHRVWVGALLLGAALPACSVPHLSLPLAWWHTADAAGGSVRVMVLAGAAGAPGTLRIAPLLLYALCAVYGCVLVYGAARLAWGLRAVARLRARAARLELPLWNSLRVDTVGLAVALAVSEDIDGPMVVGMRPAMLLLPPGLPGRLDEADVLAALAHELAHVRRNDFVKNLSYSLAALPIAYHPCAALLRARVAESREMACDAMDAQAVGGRRQYARSLLRLAAAMPLALGGSALPAPGMFDGNTLERRMTAMMHRQKELKRAGRVMAITAMLLIAAGAGAALTGFHMDVNAAQQASGTTPRVLHVKSNVMAGNIESRPEPKYPATAKADHIQGTCTLAVTIDKQGVPTHLRVVRSVRKDIDDNTLATVKQWRYKPYLLNGEPVEVQTRINVTYTLAK